MMKIGGLLALALTFTAMQGAAQTEPQTWNTNCETDSCTLSLGVLDATSGKPVSTVLVVVPKIGETVFLGAAMPLGSALEPGIRIVQGSETINAKFQVCFPDGCRALTEIPRATIQTMTKVGSVELFAFPYSSDTPISFQVPLAGLDAALKDATATLLKTP